MNRDQAAGKWEEIKDEAKRIWSELTDDDFKKAEGSVDNLYRVIEQKFGQNKDAIKREIDELQMIVDWFHVYEC